MKKLLTAGVLAASVLLTACAGSQTATKADAVVAQAQATAQTVCGYLPTAETVLDIFLSGSSAYQTGAAIANAICSALSRPSAGRGSRPTVAGVAIRGKYVR